MLVYYDICVYASLLLSAIYACIWHKRFNINITLMFVIIPLSNLGYSILAHSETLPEALIGTKLSYLGGTFGTLFVLFSVIGICKIELPKAVRGIIISFNMLLYSTILTMDYTTLYYKDIKHFIVNGIGTLKKTYGVMHTVFVIMLIDSLTACIVITAITYIMRKDVTRRILNLLVLPSLLSLSSYILTRVHGDGMNLIPLSFVLSQVVFLMIIRRINLYDISDTAIDSLINTGDTAFISIDRKFRFIGGNETAARFFPQLREIRVDKPVSGCSELGSAIIRCIKIFTDNEEHNRLIYKSDDRIYQVNITHLYDGNKKRGYQLFITDDTQAQLAEKAKHIVEMQDKLLVGMATMVESRDNSTGGHIKRTSECVRILIDELKFERLFPMSDEFCRDVIKAAPLHDLGKIAVDDAILRKPGRFTPEEFEKMKAHAAEGARIVREILSDSDDPDFRRIAENVAHYHHERWDGSGYPDGLSREEIPLEARIMAVADVYDALVSKRVYKEKMSFEEAYKIISEGMGKHFDARLQTAFEASRPRLEEYYRSLES